MHIALLCIYHGYDDLSVVHLPVTFSNMLVTLPP